MPEIIIEGDRTLPDAAVRVLYNVLEKIGFLFCLTLGDNSETCFFIV